MLYRAPVAVYFDQRLGAVHFKSWLKYAFSGFVHENVKKEKYTRAGFGCQLKKMLMSITTKP